MIGPDLVRVRKRNGKLSLAIESPETRERSRLLAEMVLAVVSANVGQARGEVDEALATVTGEASEKKLLSALKKLALDDSKFDAQAGGDAMALRRAVFSRAAVVRRELPDGAHFDRQALLEEVARGLQLTTEQIESGLYADLRNAERLLAAPGYPAEGLVERHRQAEVQAVLLCSVRVVAEVECASADQYRALFQKLKFRQLLFQLTQREGGGYRIEIDGPYSLFDSVTKYGLELALILPALQACDRAQLSADLRWGKKREPLKFETALGRTEAMGAEGERTEIRTLLDAFQSAADWRAEPAREVLDLPGVGLCVPDLCFTNQLTGEQVLCEVLGFWNREAVWRRVELVERGLATKIVFVASARLRVSEAVLDGSESAALYVYKGSINPKTLVRKLDELAARTVNAKPAVRAKRKK